MTQEHHSFYSVIPSSTENDRKCVREEHRAMLPEAQDIFWHDDFFENNNNEEEEDQDGIVAVFDYDYDKLWLSEIPLAAMAQLILVIFLTLYATIFLGVYGALSIGVLVLVVLCPCSLQRQVDWYVRANHIAVTRDGIRLVQDRRNQNCCGLSLCSSGKHCQTIPFDQITECDVLEPSRNPCCCVQRRLTHVVNVETVAASSSPSSGSNNKDNKKGVRKNNISIAGLKEPHKFQALVLAMKEQTRCQYLSTSSALPLPKVMALNPLPKPTIEPPTKIVLLPVQPVVVI